MNLLAIRTEVTKQSGRLDLVTPATFADNGMDFYINSAQRWLNKKSAFPRAFAHLSSTLSSESYAHELSNKFKSLTSVIVDDGATAAWTLEYKTLAELEALYDLGTYTTPHYYSYASYRTLKTASSATLANFVALTWPDDEDDRFDYSGIVTVPAADTDYTLTASGEFLPLELSENTDTNYWTDEYPELLVMATRRFIAVADRDVEEIYFWTSVIKDSIGIFDFNKDDAFGPKE